MEIARFAKSPLPGEAEHFGSLKLDYETPQASEQDGPKPDHGQPSAADHGYR